MRGQLILMAVVVGQIISLTTEAKTIHLKNGKALEGEVESMTDDDITVAIPGVGSMTFARTEVVGIDAPPPEHQGQVFINGEWMSVEAAQLVSASWARDRQSEQPAANLQPNPHYESAKSLYQRGQYEQAEAKAQRALENAIRHGDKATAQTMQQLIRESRRLQSEQRQKDREREAVEKQEQEQRAAEERKQQALEEEKRQQEKRNAEYRRAMCQSDCRATCDNFPEEQREYFPGGEHVMYPRQGCLKLCEEKC